MIDGLLRIVTVIAALGAGLVAGVFFAFSTFVMAALRRLPPAQGIAAMQSINVTVINPLFMGAFLGTAAGCALVGVLSLIQRPAGWVLLLVGSVLYVVGTFVVTIAFNVPRNTELAAMDPARVGAATLWTDYVTSWTVWNHVRTAAALVASTVLVLALA